MSAAAVTTTNGLSGEVTKRSGLLHRRRRLDVLVDRAAHRARGRGAGSRLVPGPRRQAAEVELPVQARQTQPRRRRGKRGHTLEEVAGVRVPRRRERAVAPGT